MPRSKLNTDLKVSKRDDLRKRIVKLILSGAIKPGQKLREQILADSLRVSRTPLREALISLARDGFVEAQPNTGFSVVPLSRQEAEELYPIVGELEALALRLCFERVRTIVDDLVSINNRFLRARNDAELARKLDQDFHRALLSSCTNTTLHGIIAGLTQKLARYESMYMQEASLVKHSFQQHQQILTALIEGRCPEAMEALRHNWMFGLHAYLARNPTG